MSADERRLDFVPVKPGDELPDDDHMTWTCGVLLAPGVRCNTVTQGGRRGLVLHQQVVHDGETS
jgi:hypothetical protein